jgi:DNA-directed RNA polymerase alpha subunit
MRKIIQFQVFHDVNTRYTYCYGLCDDGTLWELTIGEENPKWTEITQNGLNDRPGPEDPNNQFLMTKIEDLEISSRSQFVLSNADIKYVYELVQKSPSSLLKLHNFGRKSLNEIIDVLTEQGLTLKLKEK